MYEKPILYKKTCDSDVNVYIFLTKLFINVRYRLSSRVFLACTNVTHKDIKVSELVIRLSIMLYKLLAYYFDIFMIMTYVTCDHISLICFLHIYRL